MSFQDNAVQHYQPDRTSSKNSISQRYKTVESTSQHRLANKSKKEAEKLFSAEWKDELILELADSRTFVEAVLWANSLIQRQDGFRPCQQICEQGELDELLSDELSFAEVMRVLKNFYNENGIDSFLEPRFNFSILLLSIYSSVMPVKILSHFEQLIKSKSHLRDLYVANKILVSFAVFHEEISKNIEHAKELEGNIKKIKDIHRSCLNNSQSSLESIKMCQELIRLN